MRLKTRGSFNSVTPQNGQNDCRLGRSKRRTEAYLHDTLRDLSDARTPLAIISAACSGCSNRSSNEAAAEENTAGVALGYVEDVFEERTKLGTCFSKPAQKKAMLA